MDGVRGNVGPGEGFGDDVGHGDEGVGGFFAAFENRCIAGFDGEGDDVGDDFGSGFEDDEEDSDWTANTLKDQVVVESGAEGAATDGIREIAHIEDTLEHLVIFPRLGQVQS